MNCTCCGSDREILTIELAVGGYGGSKDSARYYFPNDFGRKDGYGRHNILEIPFCRRCMRVLEDTFRASILYLQKEHDLEEKTEDYYYENFKFETKEESDKISKLLREIKG